MEHRVLTKCPVPVGAEYAGTPACSECVCVCVGRGRGGGLPWPGMARSTWWLDESTCILRGVEAVRSAFTY